MNYRTRLENLLKSHGVDNEELIESLLHISSEPHGLSEEVVKELTASDLGRELNDGFRDTNVPIKVVQKAANYGLKYGLTSSHKGFVPMGNVMQWLMGQEEYKNGEVVKY